MTPIDAEPTLAATAPLLSHPDLRTIMPVISIVAWLVFTLLSAWRLLHDLDGVFFPSDLALLGVVCMFVGTCAVARIRPPRPMRWERLPFALVYAVGGMILLVAVFDASHIPRMDMALISHIAAVATGTMGVVWASYRSFAAPRAPA